METLFTQKFLEEHATKVLFDGGRYYINIEKGNFSIGNEIIVSEWKPVNGEWFSMKTDIEDFKEQLLKLFNRYSDSVPSRRKNKRELFYYDEHIDHIQSLTYFESKYDAQFLIEAYLLGSIINGTINESLFGNGYFWSHPQNRNLVILKSCFTNFQNSHK